MDYRQAENPHEVAGEGSERPAKRGRSPILPAHVLQAVRLKVASLVDGTGIPLTIETMRSLWQATIVAEGHGYLLPNDKGEGGCLKLSK